MRMMTGWMMGPAMAAACWVAALPVQAGFKVADHDGRIEIRDGGKLVFGWQYELLKEPAGGAKFAGSAFLHPLCPPSGFDLTRIQPDDHLHHYGVWWPWKLLTVKGKKYVTWEMQQGQGHQIGVSAQVKSQATDEVVLEVRNKTEIKPAGMDYQPVVEEHATLCFARFGDDAYTLDITIENRPMKGVQVEVTQYRYSGFSWRGTADWNKDNSRMTTSGGQNRDNANGQEANWVLVDGKTPSGKASMLMMSAAAKEGGSAERLRVWNSKMTNGAPFVNFNPVMKKSMPLVPTQKEVASRRYRLVIADRVIQPAEAEKLWKAWK